MKTNLENATDFYDVLNFNYKFKDINSKLNHLKNFEKFEFEKLKIASFPVSPCTSKSKSFPTYLCKI